MVAAQPDDHRQSCQVIGRFNIRDDAILDSNGLLPVIVPILQVNVFCRSKRDV